MECGAVAAAGPATRQLTADVDADFRAWGFLPGNRGSGMDGHDADDDAVRLRRHARMNKKGRNKMPPMLNAARLNFPCGSHGAPSSLKSPGTCVQTYGGDTDVAEAATHGGTGCDIDLGWGANDRNSWQRARTVAWQRAQLRAAQVYSAHMVMAPVMQAYHERNAQYAAAHAAVRRGLHPVHPAPHRGHHRLTNKKLFNSN